MPNYAFLGVRALALVVIAASLWPLLADGYNGLVAKLANALAPQGVALSAAFNRFQVVFTGGAEPTGLGVHGFVLHFGPILVLALMVATPRVSVLKLAAWVVGATGLFMALDVGGLALLAWGLWWASTGERATVGGVMTAFAIFWALAPAILGGAWCYRYWLPVLRAPSIGRSTS